MYVYIYIYIYICTHMYAYMYMYKTCRRRLPKSATALALLQKCASKGI